MLNIQYIVFDLMCNLKIQSKIDPSIDLASTGYSIIDVRNWHFE